MLTLATFRREYLNETVGTRLGGSIRVIERPGLWMGPDSLASVVEDLQQVIRKAIPGGELDYGAASGSKERLDDSILTIVYDAGGKPAGFNALAILPCDLRGNAVEVLHIGLSIIDPASRAKGLAGVLYGLSVFLVSARRRLRPLWISNVTQVPAVFGMVAANFCDVFPDGRAHARQRYDHLHLAREIMARHRHVFGVGDEATFDESRSIIRNSYTGGSDNLKKSFEESPKHRVASYNEICRRELDYDRGDDFLQIGRFTAAAAGAYFTRSASIISPSALAMQFGTRALDALVAPTLQWFDSKSQMGDIRPATGILPGVRR
jgi:hypothetical protein